MSLDLKIPTKFIAGASSYAILLQEEENKPVTQLIQFIV